MKNDNSFSFGKVTFVYLNDLWLTLLQEEDWGFAILLWLAMNANSRMGCINSKK